MHLLVSQLHTFQGVIVSNANVVSVNYMVTLCYIQLWHVCIACTSDSAAFAVTASAMCASNTATKGGIECVNTCACACACAYAYASSWYLLQ